MSNVIGFLERMGRDAQLRHAGNEEMQSALNGAIFDPEMQAAILQGDQSVLEELLGARTNVMCLVAPAREDEEQRDSPVQDDDEEIRSQAAHRAASAG